MSLSSERGANRVLYAVVHLAEEILALLVSVLSDSCREAPDARKIPTQYEYVDHLGRSFGRLKREEPARVREQ